MKPACLARWRHMFRAGARAALERGRGCVRGQGCVWMGSLVNALGNCGLGPLKDIQSIAQYCEGNMETLKVRTPFPTSMPAACMHCDIL